MAGFSWKIAWDTNPLKRGGQEAAQVIEKAAETFEDLARDADRATEKAGEQLGDDIKAGAKSATSSVEKFSNDSQKALDDLEAKFRATQETASSSGRQMSQDFGGSIKRGTQEASEGQDALRENFKQNAKETAASFDGSVQSAVNGAQGLAAEVFEGFGPAGVAAGLAAGAGIGLVNTFIQKAKEKAQEAAQKIADMAGALIDVGSTTLDASHVNDTLKTWATTAEGGKNKLDALAKTAQRAGIDFTEFARGVAGDNEASKRSYDEVTKKLNAYQDTYDDLGRTYGYTSGELGKWLDKNTDAWDASSSAQKQLLATNATLDQSAEVYRELQTATSDYAQSADDASGSTDVLKGSIEDSIAKWGAHAEAVQEDAQATRDKNSANHSLFDSETALGQAIADTTQTLKDNAKAGLDPSTDAGRANRQAISDLAGAYESASDAIVTAGGSQEAANAKINEGRAEVVKQAEALGISADQANAYADQLGLIPTAISSTVTVSTPDKQISDTKARLDAIAQGQYTAVLRADTAQATRDIESWRARYATFNVDTQMRLNYRPGQAQVS